MLAGVLAVLKVIGIILLTILAVIIVFTLLVLFVPICYRADAVVPDTDLEHGFKVESINASASFSWLLFVLRGGIDFPKNKAFTVKIFGIQILPKKEKSGKKEEKTKEDEDPSKGDEKDESEKPSQGDEKDESEKTPKAGEMEESQETPPSGEKEEAQETSQSYEAAESQESSQSGGMEGTQETSQGEAKDESLTSSSDEEKDTAGKTVNEEDAGDEDEKSFLDVLWKILDTIENIINVPLNVFEKIGYTISRVCDRIDMIKSTLENDIFKRAYGLVKKKLIVILKMILPDKCDIRILAGTGDPASTAALTGFYSMLYPMLYNKVYFKPDFNRMAVKADIHLKGHITLFTIIYSAAVCYFNKDVKKTIRRFKKIIQA